MRGTEPDVRLQDRQAPDHPVPPAGRSHRPEQRRGADRVPRGHATHGVSVPQEGRNTSMDHQENIQELEQSLIETLKIQYDIDVF